MITYATNYATKELGFCQQQSINQLGYWASSVATSADSSTPVSVNC